MDAHANPDVSRGHSSSQELGIRKEATVRPMILLSKDLSPRRWLFSLMIIVIILFIYLFSPFLNIITRDN